jgi:hypothetical protein
MVLSHNQDMRELVVALAVEAAGLLDACMLIPLFQRCNSMYVQSARYARSILAGAVPERLLMVCVSI